MSVGTGFSLQVELIRQIQADNGQEVCYATPVSAGCTKKQNECTWRHDCYLDAEEQEVDRCAARCGNDQRHLV